MESVLAKLADNDLKPGEFTALQVYEQHRTGGGTKSLEAIRSMMKRMADNGDLLTRQIIENGKVANAYRVP